MRNRLISFLLLCGFLLLILCGCGNSPEPGKTPEQPSGHESVAEDPQDPVSPETPQDPNPPEDPELSDPNRDWEPIDTKFGRLRYPDDLFDYLQTEQTEREEEVTVMFRAIIGDRQIDMFEVTIGQTDGEPAGKITGPDDVVRDVFLRVFPIDDLSGLSDGETDRVYAMQEALNFVLDHLK